MNSPAKRRGYKKYCKAEKFISAEVMRNLPTPAEELFFNTIRECKFRIRNQAVILGWIADGWIPSVRLVVEIDGRYHEKRAAYDANRDRVMFEKLGIITLRLTNDEVFADPNLCARKVISLASRLPKYRSAMESPHHAQESLKAYREWCADAHTRAIETRHSIVAERQDSARKRTQPKAAAPVTGESVRIPRNSLSRGVQPVR